MKSYKFQPIERDVMNDDEIMIDKPEEEVRILTDVLECENAVIKEIRKDIVTCEITDVLCAKIDMDRVEPSEDILYIEPVQEECSDSDDSDASCKEGIFVSVF